MRPSALTPSCPRDQANYTNASSYASTSYNVDVRFEDTNDEDFSGHVRTTSYAFSNTVPYSDLTYVVSPHSNDFTTTHGGTISLFVSLTRAPSEDTVVRFSVSTSDPTTAYIEHGELLVFTPENWDIGIPVLVRGVYQVGRSCDLGRSRGWGGGRRHDVGDEGMLAASHLSCS